MQEKKENTNTPVNQKEKNAVDGYPAYPAKEDIYNKNVEEENINPEDVTESKTPNEMYTNLEESEKDFDENRSGDDLDDEIEPIGRKSKDDH